MMKTVLVIDDEKCLRELIREVLEGPDCRVLLAGRASEGLELARREQPDLMLLDYIMPGISGMQLLQTLKTSPETAAIPVVVMSGMDAESVVNDLAHGAAAYLQKPFSASKLRLLMKELSVPKTSGQTVPPVLLASAKAGQA